MVIYNVENIQNFLDFTCADHTMWLDLAQNKSKFVKKGGNYLDTSTSKLLEHDLRQNGER